MPLLLRAAAPWLWMAIGGEIPEVKEPVLEPEPEPALGDMGLVKVLLLPAPPAGAYWAALLEPGVPALAPAAAVAEAWAFEFEPEPEPDPDPDPAFAPAAATAEAPAFELEPEPEPGGPEPNPAGAPAAAAAEAVA
jgi:hypothetical protein